MYVSLRVVAALFLAAFSVTPALTAPIEGGAARDLSLFARASLKIRGGVADGNKIITSGN
ncbi:hypothetical protein V8E53_012131 [Lactarius tabidus]